jgi:hypothetical protein
MVQVINMSLVKFSLHKKWVLESFQYAEEHNVLLVHCSGNGFNVDENPYYPTMLHDGSKEVCNNFINVGSISSKLDSSFIQLLIMVSKMWIYLHLVKKSILLRQGILMLQILALHLLAQWFRGLLL